MAIPRRLIVLAVSAAAAGAMLYVSSRMKKQQQERSDKSPIDEANEKKEEAEKKKKEEEKKSADSSSSSSSSTSEKKEEAPASSSSPSSTAQKELALFLAGDAWHDEIGWQALWEKEGVTSPEEWLKKTGKDVLVGERKKLTDHPALLAGCRRRWIVVCRYAGIDVGDAASLWTSTEVTV